MKIQNNYTQTNFGQLYIASIEAEKLFLIDEKGKKYKLNFDCINCEMIIIN